MYHGRCVCDICRFLYNALSRVLCPDFDRLTYTHRPELMKSVDGRGSCSLTALLLFRVWGLTICEQLSHKVMTAFIFMLPSNCCRGDFSAVFYIFVHGEKGYPCFLRV